MTAELGRSIVGPATSQGRSTTPRRERVTTRGSHSLWAARWPAIALQSCIEAVEAAPPEQQAEVKRALPCSACPENTRCLNAKRLEIGPLLFDREILTRPRAAESSLFPRDLMAPMLDETAELVPHYRKPLGAESRLVVVSGWDLAWSEKTGGDWLVRITALADRHTGRFRLLDIFRDRGLRFTQQKQQIVADHGRYAEDLVVIEADAAQVIWTQQLEEETSVPVLRHYAAGSKRDLHVGVPSLLIDFANRRWDLPHKSNGRGFDEVEMLLDELEAFGWTDGKLEGSGEHDDCVMGLWHCQWGLRMMLGGFGEHHYGVQDGRG